MALTPSSMVALGTRAPSFTLPDTNGALVSLPKPETHAAVLVVFMCNHCPYVKAVLDRIVRDARELERLGIGTVAISSNDPIAYPEDSFEAMQKLAREKALPFPYLFDETQQVARAYDAVCTPDFFGFNNQLELQYRGRLDASRREAVPDAPRELFDAMKMVAVLGHGPLVQHPSIGCSIKWREAITA
jgi:peroxiredoxin